MGESTGEKGEPQIVARCLFPQFGEMQLALEKRGKADAFYDTKLKTARFYFARLMPETGSLFATVMGGKKSLMEMTAAVIQVMFHMDLPITSFYQLTHSSP